MARRRRRRGMLCGAESPPRRSQWALLFQIAAGGGCALCVICPKRVERAKERNDYGAVFKGPFDDSFTVGHLSPSPATVKWGRRKISKR